MPFDPECDRGELAWDLFPNGIHFCVTYRLLKQGKDTSAQVIVSGLVSPGVTGMLCHIMTGRITAREPGLLNRLRFSELDTTMTGNNECHNNAIPGWFFFPNILLSCWKNWLQPDTIFDIIKMMEVPQLKPPVWQVTNRELWQIHLKGVQVAEGGLTIEKLPCCLMLILHVRQVNLYNNTVCVCVSVNCGDFQ